MKRWTAAAFEAALERQVSPDNRAETVWLRQARASGKVRVPASLRRHCERVARGVTLFGLGCVASAAIPDSALAPIGHAQAAVEARLVLTPPPEPSPSLAPLGETIEIALPEIEPPAPVELQDQAEELDEYLRFGAREVPRRIVETILRAARVTDVDAVYLMALADTESSLKPDARAPTSSAEGLFQFVDRTWLEMVRQKGAEYGLDREAEAIASENGRPVVADETTRALILGLRRDPYLSAVMAAELLKQDAASAGFRIGRTLTHADLYLAHFLGLDEAVRFLTLRGARRPPAAARAFPAAAKANANIFYVRGKRGKLKSLSLGEVYRKIDHMIGRKADRFRDLPTMEARL